MLITNDNNIFEKMRKLSKMKLIHQFSWLTMELISNLMKSQHNNEKTVENEAD